jgi:hypothetical protein
MQLFELSNPLNIFGGAPVTNLAAKTTVETTARFKFFNARPALLCPGPACLFLLEG